MGHPAPGVCDAGFVGMAEAGPFENVVCRGFLGWVGEADPLHPCEQKRSQGTPAFEDDRKSGNGKSKSNGNGKGKGLWVGRLWFPTHALERSA